MAAVGAAMVFIIQESFEGVFGMLGTRRAAVVFALAAGLAWFSSVPAHAQGCIVARSSSADMAPESQGGYLEPGDWSVVIGYRHQFSYKHFVGDVEQTYRVQQGTEVMNKINLEDVNVTYQATPRLSFTLTVPLLFASRRSGRMRVTLGRTYVHQRKWNRYVTSQSRSLRPAGQLRWFHRRQRPRPFLRERQPIVTTRASARTAGSWYSSARRTTSSPMTATAPSTCLCGIGNSAEPSS